MAYVEKGEGCAGCTGCSSGVPRRGCGACCGRREIIFSKPEVDALMKFAETPFYPAAFMEDNVTPHSNDFVSISEQYENVLTALQSKMLISIDADIPLAGFDYSSYPAYPIHGSMALTAFGQAVLEQLEVRGTEDSLC